MIRGAFQAKFINILSSKSMILLINSLDWDIVIILSCFFWMNGDWFQVSGCFVVTFEANLKPVNLLYLSNIKKKRPTEAERLT